MNALKLYKTYDEYKSVRPTLRYPTVVKTDIDDTNNYNMHWHVDYKDRDENYYKYFTLEILENEQYAGEIEITIKAYFDDHYKLMYSTDGGETWNQTADGLSGYKEIYLYFTPGDKVIFKGNILSKQLEQNQYFWFSDNEIEGYKCKISGNIMSLAYEDDFIGKDSMYIYDSYTESTTACRLNNMFTDFWGLVDASELVLPAIELTPSCYKEMFSHCAYLEKAPILICTDVTGAGNYYFLMFYNCNKLSQVQMMALTWDDYDTTFISMCTNCLPTGKFLYNKDLKNLEQTDLYQNKDEIMPETWEFVPV